MINTEKKKKALNYKGSVIGKMSVLFVHMRMIELRVCVAYLQADSHSTWPSKQTQFLNAANHDKDLAAIYFSC